MTYDYKQALIDDIREYIADNYDDTEELDEESLYDELWVADSVTGNASGSYYCNRYKAMQSAENNLRIAAYALTEFGYEDATLQEKIRADDWEWIDVTIRCYLLGSALHEVLSTRG